MTYRRQSSSKQRNPGTRRRNQKGGLLFAVIIAGFALFKFCASADYNEITGETQYVGINENQEIAIGLQSAPQMIQQYGGLNPNIELQELVRGVGNTIVSLSDAGTTPYEFDFHLLADNQTLNAFALPGGQVFVTSALFNQLETEDQLAGVIGHEIGHVIARHGAERIAKQELSNGLTGAAVIASGDYKTAAAAQMISNLVNMSYGRDQELQSDRLGVRFMIQAGYNPQGLIDVMEVLERASNGQKKNEFLSTHPSYDHRLETIIAAIKEFTPEIQ